MLAIVARIQHIQHMGFSEKLIVLLNLGLDFGFILSTDLSTWLMNLGEALATVNDKGDNFVGRHRGASLTSKS